MTAVFMTFSLLLTTSLSSSIVTDFIWNFRSSNCPGLIIHNSSDLKDDVISNLTNILPVTLLEDIIINPHHDYHVCNDLLLLNHPADKLLILHNKFRTIHHIHRVLIVAQCTANIARKVLQQIQDERTFLLCDPDGPILRWTANGQVLSAHQKSSSLTGRHLLIATLNYPPAVFVSPSTREVSGIEPAIMDLLSDGLGFTFDYLLAPDGEMWGEITADGNQTGIRGMVYRKEADVAFGDMYLNPTWAGQLLDYSYPYKTNYDCFLLPVKRFHFEI